MLKNKLKIAIAGIGTVGSGLLDLLKKYKDQNIEVSAIASRKHTKLKGKYFKNTTFFKDAKYLLDFNDYDVLVELIGGDSGIAKLIVIDALNKKRMSLQLIKHLFLDIGTIFKNLQQLTIVKLSLKQLLRVVFQ